MRASSAFHFNCPSICSIIFASASFGSKLNNRSQLFGLRLIGLRLLRIVGRSRTCGKDWPFEVARAVRGPDLLISVRACAHRYIILSSCSDAGLCPPYPIQGMADPTPDYFPASALFVVFFFRPCLAKWPHSGRIGVSQGPCLGFTAGSYWPSSSVAFHKMWQCAHVGLGAASSGRCKDTPVQLVLGCYVTWPTSPVRNMPGTQSLSRGGCIRVLPLTVSLFHLCLLQYQYPISAIRRATMATSHSANTHKQPEILYVPVAWNHPLSAYYRASRQTVNCIPPR